MSPDSGQPLLSMYHDYALKRSSSRKSGDARRARREFPRLHAKGPGLGMLPLIFDILTGCMDASKWMQPWKPLKAQSTRLHTPMRRPDGSNFMGQEIRATSRSQRRTKLLCTGHATSEHATSEVERLVRRIRIRTYAIRAIQVSLRLSQ